MLGVEQRASAEESAVGGYFSDYLKTINILMRQKMAGSHHFNAVVVWGSSDVLIDTSYYPTITGCDLSPEFICIETTLLCKFESNKI